MKTRSRTYCLKILIRFSGGYICEKLVLLLLFFAFMKLVGNVLNAKPRTSVVTVALRTSFYLSTTQTRAMMRFVTSCLNLFKVIG